MKEKKGIGIDVNIPSKKCNDACCPFHSNMRLHGKVFSGVVRKVNVHKTATIEWPRTHFIPKYERYEKRRTTVKAHKPDCIEVNAGDSVIIAESKPISKTKNFVIIEVSKNEST
ncbi:30S ribosomal protein S17 [Candidatus Woesearchaeota archaeon]|nr:30S ribosomal protein S17 [Candidatus Woesearchaeota archaeon]